MTNTATWPLRLLPGRLTRTLTIVAVSIAVVALVALTFAVGRWTHGSDNPQAPAQNGPAVVQQVPALVCHLHGAC